MEYICIDAKSDVRCADIRSQSRDFSACGLLVLLRMVGECTAYIVHYIDATFRRLTGDIVSLFRLSPCNGSSVCTYYLPIPTAAAMCVTVTSHQVT